MSSCREAHKLNLVQCLSTQANNYTSKDCKVDYDAESVDERIIALQSKADAIKVKALMINVGMIAARPMECPEFHYTYAPETESYILF